MTKSIRDLARERGYQMRFGLLNGGSAPLYWPLIALSRERGAGGTALAKGVAEQLHFALWDGALLTRIAEESGAVESALASVDEQPSSRITEFFQTLFMGAEYTQSEYLGTLSNVLLGIARQGAAVVVGRGAHLILHPDRVLRVRVVCPFDVRVDRLMKSEGLTQKDAAHRLHAWDTEAASFIRHNFHRDIACPTNFDLVVNTEHLTPEAAQSIVVQAYASRFGRLPEQVALRAQA